MANRTLSDDKIREDYDMDPEEFWELYQSKNPFSWIENLDLDQPIVGHRSKTKWRAGVYFSERVTHTERTEYEQSFSEASAICVATQVDGPNVGMKAILKTRIEIPPWLDSVTEMGYNARYSSRTGRLGPYAKAEMANLKRLTDLGSTCTPKLIDISFRKQKECELVHGGYLVHILMEKIPGRNLLNFGDFTMPERDQIRIAFGKTLRTIIDLESVRTVGESEECHKFTNSIEFFRWYIASPGGNTQVDGIDPMVSYIGYRCEPEFDDAALEKLAADASGEDIYFWDRRKGRMTADEMKDFD